jgi:phosphopantetheine adenylyltransferase / dephospho-CoA kinase
LAKLNSIVWPQMWEVVRQKIDHFKKSGVKIVVLEAAVLARAGWHRRCHEVWSVFVPQVEVSKIQIFLTKSLFYFILGLLLQAIKRLQERDRLSEDDSKLRCAAQPPNSDHVKLGNVLLSPSWSPEHTDRQVERAWVQLQSRVTAMSSL